MSLTDWVNIWIYGWLGMDVHSQFAQALHFFIYDSIKITLLLFLITFVMGIFQSYVSVQKLQKWLVERQWYGFEYWLAAGFGALTPFCSCSSVPLFIGFVRGGIPFGVTLAFLITSPLVNEAALAIFIASFGIQVTLIYALSGIVLGVLGGWILGRLGLQKWLKPWVLELLQGPQVAVEFNAPSLRTRLRVILRDMWQIFKRIGLWILLGVGLGAWLHGYVPAGSWAPWLQWASPWDVPLAVCLGIPLYAQAAAVVPLVQVLIAKGVPMGTALAFMMATVGLSLPEGIMLSQVMNRKLILSFFATMALLMVLLGYFYKWIF